MLHLYCIYTYYSHQDYWRAAERCSISTAYTLTTAPRTTGGQQGDAPSLTAYTLTTAPRTTGGQQGDAPSLLHIHLLQPPGLLEDSKVMLHLYCIYAYYSPRTTGGQQGDAPSLLHIHLLQPPGLLEDSRVMLHL